MSSGGVLSSVLSLTAAFSLSAAAFSLTAAGFSPLNQASSGLITAVHRNRPTGITMHVSQTITSYKTELEESETLTLTPRPLVNLHWRSKVNIRVYTRRSSHDTNTHKHYYLHVPPLPPRASSWTMGLSGDFIHSFFSSCLN